MPGLVPGIHVFTGEKKSWMAGTSPDKPSHDGRCIYFNLAIATPSRAS